MINIKTLFKTVGVSFLSKAILIISGIIFARNLGVEQYGHYSFSLSLVYMFSVIIYAGLPNLLIREISREKDNDIIIGNIIRWSKLNSIKLAFFSIILYSLFFLLGDKQGQSVYLYVSGSLLIYLRGDLVRVCSIITAESKPFKSILFGQLSQPLILVLLFFSLFLFGEEVNVIDMMMITFLSYFITYIIANNSVKINSDVACLNEKSKEWRKAMLPFALMTVLGVFSNEIGIVLLGYLSNNTEVGIYKVATQAVIVISLALSAINTIIGPKISVLHKENKLENLQKLLRQSVWLNMVISFPILLILFFFSDYLINIFFGFEYIESSKIIKYLCLGQFFNISFGSVMLVLNMTNNEKTSVKWVIISLALNLLLLFIFVPSYGAIGAAISSVSTMFFWNLMLAVEIRKILGVKSWVH
ncbi:oligosaccharide flippase family protein [Vibrio mytili]|uniref:oligosaccharide flippase family protein n=1 Tax=Vibrio mytili TaxID=50718 RepID=UPI002F41EE00